MGSKENVVLAGLRTLLERQGVVVVSVQDPAIPEGCRAC
jgi:hypothetical protein